MRDTPTPTRARPAPMSVTALARDIFARARQRRAGRLAAHSLRHLDDHLLRDIGITRDAIDTMVRNGGR